jgi:hypothetical protein
MLKDVDREPARERAAVEPSKLAAANALRAYQQDYPDYGVDDWVRAVKTAFARGSVLSVAEALAGMADLSLRGIEVSQRDLAEDCGYSQKSVSRAITELSGAGYVIVARRPVQSDGENVWQWPDGYRLVIPGGATWSMSPVGPEGPYSVSHSVNLSDPGADTPRPWEAVDPEGAMANGDTICVHCSNPSRFTTCDGCWRAGRRTQMPEDASGVAPWDAAGFKVWEAA